MQFYAPTEQIMRDRSEYARKGIARGRSVVVLTYAGGVLFVAENPSTALHKVSEIYDRIGFAGVGRYNEFENLRRAGVRMADLNGFSYDRRDVTGRALANAYAQTLGAIFTEQSKPFEVEICVAEVGASPDQDELYRLTYDGSVQDEPGVVAMGGQADAIVSGLRQNHREDMALTDALRLAVQALGSVGGEVGAPRSLAANQLEVAVLDRSRTGRTFRRVTGAALTALLERTAPATGAEPAAAAEPSAAGGAAQPAPGESQPPTSGETAQPVSDEPQPPTSGDAARPAPGEPGAPAQGDTPAQDGDAAPA
jgi:proteasome alpha subunit